MKSKKEIMLEAHKLAATFEGNYSVRLKMALEIIWAKELLYDNKSTDVVYNHECLLVDDYQGRAICKLVSFISTGFQADIANRYLRTGIISEKQAWCVAFEYKKVA